MRDLLFLAHRIPYPPEKGEKIRAWHAFLELARTHRMHLGCFIDDPVDEAHVATLAAHCVDLKAIRIDGRRQRVRALLRTRPGQPLSLSYFFDARMAAWVAGKRAQGIDRAFVYCSAMAPYVMGAAGLYRVLDMVDVDSAKWSDYAKCTSWPARTAWAREARTLLAFERRAVVDFDRTLFVSEAECRTFLALAPWAAERCDWFDNGVDAAYFAPDPSFASPYSPGGPVVVFTGTMDYRPNVDAVVGFARTVLPLLQAARPDPRGAAPLRFAIVGANPAPAVRRLAALPGVTVTGRVPDVRPYLAHAAVAVAPLTIARGIQNKVLEAMAMARPVVATPQALEGIDAAAGRELLVSDGATAFAAAVSAVLDGRHPGLGAAARAAILRRYVWSATLPRLAAAMPPGGRHEIFSASIKS